MLLVHLTVKEFHQAGLITYNMFLNIRTFPLEQVPFAVPVGHAYNRFVALGFTWRTRDTGYFFFDYFYDDARYTEWVDMEGFLPATKSGGEALAAANEDMASWIDILDSCKFYPTAKAEWADVKQGVINVEQNALLGGDVQELLDDLQAEIAG